jgi:hypothetical protein
MTHSYYSDDYEQQQYERERRREIEAEQEPAWIHYRPRNRFLGRNRPGPERRYFSRLMFKPILADSADATSERMSYIRGDEDPAGHIDHGAHAASDEGRDTARRDRGAAHAQPDGGGRDGAVPGVAA